MNHKEIMILLVENTFAARQASIHSHGTGKDSTLKANEDLCY
jgi:hypothetical protein